MLLINLSYISGNIIRSAVFLNVDFPHIATRFSQNKCIKNTLPLLLSTNPPSYPGESINVQDTLRLSHLSQFTSHF